MLSASATLSMTMAIAMSRPSPGWIAAPTPMLRPSMISSALVPPASTVTWSPRGLWRRWKRATARCCSAFSPASAPRWMKRSKPYTAAKPRTKPAAVPVSELSSRACGTIWKAMVAKSTPLAKPSASDMTRLDGCRHRAKAPPTGEAMAATPATARVRTRSADWEPPSRPCGHASLCRQRQSRVFAPALDEIPAEPAPGPQGRYSGAVFSPADRSTAPSASASRAAALPGRSGFC